MNLSYTCTQTNNYPVINENMQIKSKGIMFVESISKKHTVEQYRNITNNKRHRLPVLFLVNCSVSVKGLIRTAKSCLQF